MKRHGGRIADAAAHAGVERESCYRLLRKYGVQLDGSLAAPEAKLQTGQSFLQNLLLCPSRLKEVAPRQP
jgi:hypothetical protein